MKKTILAVTALAMAAATAPQARANDCGWATTGKVLTGVLAGVALVKTVEAVTAPPRVVVQQPVPVVVQQPAQVVVQQPVQVVAQPAQPVVQGSPVYVVPAPQVVYVPAAPVYVAPAPVYVAPAPVVVPRPFIGVRVGFGYHHPHYPPYHRVCR